MVTWSCRTWPLVGLAILVGTVAGCDRKKNPQPTPPASAPTAPATSASVTAAEPDLPAGDAGAGASAKPKPDLTTWLRANVPAGGSVEGSPPVVMHTVGAGETFAAIAAKYLAITDVLKVGDLELRINRKNAGKLIAGSKIEIPDVVREPLPATPIEGRLGWPADSSLRGVFMAGWCAAKNWVETLDKLAERGMNAVVLDSKDYMGPVTYPSKVQLANDIKATAKPDFPDLAREIRFAHQRGIHVILRIPCFHDPWAAKRAPRLSLKSPVTGAPVSNFGWLDPTNVEAQDYAIALAKEGIEAGADEIQLDYVRFPVHITGAAAKMPAKKDRSAVIRDFVKRVHDVTKPAGVMLSLDLFGVAATGERDDIESLGQDIAIVSGEAEAISPMVYPSHYSRGYKGFKEPGNHPEIIGIGTKAALEQLDKGGVKGTVVRSWLQAFPWRAPIYGPKYVFDQAQQAETHGGKGWLMWSANCDYRAVWAGFPKKASAKAP